MGDTDNYPYLCKHILEAGNEICEFKKLLLPNYT
jgi:hypothetical protein